MSDMKLIPTSQCAMAEFYQPDHDLSKAALDRLNAQISEWTVHPMGSQYGLSGYVEPNLRIPVWDDELFAWIMGCVKTFSDRFVGGADLAVVDAWLTRNQLGCQGLPHIHINSMVSGIYYFTDFPTGIEFQIMNGIFDRWKGLLDLGYPSKCYEILKLECRQGRLLLFDSQLKHSIDKITVRNKVRYSLAFNLFPTTLDSRPTTHLQYRLRTAEQAHKEYQQSLGAAN